MLTISFFHSYYVNGRDTSLEDFLNPDILDTLALKTNEVLEVVTCGAISDKIHYCGVGIE